MSRQIVIVDLFASGGGTSNGVVAASKTLDMVIMSPTRNRL